MPLYFLTCTVALLLMGCDSYQPASAPLPKKPTPKAKPFIEKVVLQPPTDNHALFETGAENSFYTPTGPERPWSSGAYGCVRNSGNRMHEGVDIQCLQRNPKGEPIDEVRAAALGQVVFSNRIAGASSYGKYVVLTQPWCRYVHQQRCIQTRWSIHGPATFSRCSPVGLGNRSYVGRHWNVTVHRSISFRIQKIP